MTTMNDKVANGTYAAEGFVKDAGATTRDKVGDLATAVGTAVRFFRSLEDDAAIKGRSLLSKIGLQPRQSPLVGIGLFTTGVLVGGGVAMLFAPMTGEDLRSRIKTQFKELIDGKGKVGEAIAKGVDGAKHAAEQFTSKVEGEAKTTANHVANTANTGADKAKTTVESLADRIDDQLKARGGIGEHTRNGH